MSKELVCSFCGCSQDGDRKLVGGPGGAAICNECVALCAQVLDAGAVQLRETVVVESHDAGGRWQATVTRPGQT
jgi:ATP-dependent protease Clp ATPase subunit